MVNKFEVGKAYLLCHYKNPSYDGVDDDGDDADTITEYCDAWIAGVIVDYDDDVVQLFCYAVNKDYCVEGNKGDTTWSCGSRYNVNGAWMNVRELCDDEAKRMFLLEGL